MNRLLQAALDYANMGYAVFPCNADKTPATRHGFKDASKDAEVIRGWWTQQPTALIGLPCGSVNGDLVVVDIDNKNGKNGAAALDEWALVFGRLPDTYTVKTPTGGCHLYYTYPGGGRSPAGVLSGVDIRGNGGYVIAPPSGINGVEYEVVNPANIAPGGEVLGRLIDYAENHKNGAESSKFSLDKDVIPEGERNSTMFSLACSLRDKGLSANAISVSLETENAARCVPPLSDSELNILFNSAMKYEPKHSYIKRENTGNKGLRSVEAIEIERPRWVWEPYIRRGNINILRGDPGIGKSFLTIAIMAAVNSGTKPDKMPGKLHESHANVLYFGREESAGETKARILDSFGSQAASAPGLYIVDDMLTFVQDMAEITRLIREAAPALVVFDPLQTFLGAKADINKANETRAILEPLRTIAAELDCAILLIEHMNKDSKKQFIYRGIGSQDITGAARSVLAVVRNPDDKNERLAVQIKTNGKPGLTVKFAVNESGVFEWRGIDFRTAGDLERMAKAKAKAGVSPAVSYAVKLLQKYPAGFNGTAADILAACSELADRIETTPASLGRALTDEDIQYELMRDCKIKVRMTKHNGRKLYHLFRENDKNEEDEPP